MSLKLFQLYDFEWLAIKLQSIFYLPAKNHMKNIFLFWYMDIELHAHIKTVKYLKVTGN